MMATNDILHDIISLPRRFNESGDKSLYAFLEECEYAGVRDQITIDEIRDSLLKNPNCVADWIQYSADKKTVGGWYFKVRRTGEFIVGCMADGNKLEDSQQSYDDAMEACAAFVKQEIDSII
jgi:hypothetical protein